MDRPPFELAAHGIHLRDLAQSAPQEPALTAWLVAKFG
jgi:hypothetical protein